MTERLAFTVREAAAALGVSKDTLYDEVARGRLVAVKLAGRRLIRRADLDDYLEKLERNEPSGRARVQAERQDSPLLATAKSAR